jgi:hypothetical protein
VSHRAAVLIIILTAVLACLAPSAVLGQEDGYAFKLSNFSVELTGGWSSIAPGNLNRAVDNENAYLQHYYLKKYAYYDSLYGDAYSASYAYTGGKTFLPMDSITPYGAAIRYQVSPTFALSLGVQLLRGSRQSDVGLDVAVTDAPTSDFTAHYRNKGFLVAVESWMPFLGANFGWDMLKLLRTEIYLQGGPIIGDCRIYSRREESVTDAAGTIASGYRVLEMTGRSQSVAIEAGGQLRIKLLPFLEIYGQGGYAFRKLTKVRGPHTILTVSEAPVASESSYALTGIWGITWDKAQTAWGIYSAPALTTNYLNISGRNSTIPGTTVANVELSGFQLTAGIAIRL